jgi:hypothetical protein
MEIEFLGAAPSGEHPGGLIADVVEASLAYARAARLRMNLDHTKWISITVPADHAKRPLFEAAEVTLRSLRVRFDWSQFTSWTVDKALTADVDADSQLALTPDGWKIKRELAGETMFWTAGQARYAAAVLLACADAAEERNALTPFGASAEDPPAITDGTIVS